MNIKTAWKYTIFTAGITLTAIVILWSPFSKAEPECLASEGQTVVRWKDMYYGSCKRFWNGHCIWPLRRPHSTYKVTVHEGIPVRDENGQPIPMVNGKIKNWAVYDATTWNSTEHQPRKKNIYPDYEPIADNEYVVLVETRYRLFNKVEDILRICTQKP